MQTPLARGALAVFAASVALAGCADTGGDSGDQAAEPPAIERTSERDRQLERALGSDLRDLGMWERYDVAKVAVDDGIVRISTGVGDDADGEFAVTGICTELFGIAGDDAREGVKDIEVLGRSKYGHDALMGRCKR